VLEIDRTTILNVYDMGWYLRLDMGFKLSLRSGLSRIAGGARERSRRDTRIEDPPLNRFRSLAS
jgi:hypothetical protein